MRVGLRSTLQGLQPAPHLFQCLRGIRIDQSLQIANVRIGAAEASREDGRRNAAPRNRQHAA
jgi:hypothetical protein